MRIKQNLKGLALVLAAGSACIPSNGSNPPIPDGIPRYSTSYIGLSTDEFYKDNDFGQVMNYSLTARIPIESDVLMPSGDTVTSRILEVYPIKKGGGEGIFSRLREDFSTFPIAEEGKEEQFRNGLLRLYFDGEVDILQYQMCDSINPLPEGWSSFEDDDEFMIRNEPSFILLNEKSRKPNDPISVMDPYGIGIVYIQFDNPDGTSGIYYDIRCPLQPILPQGVIALLNEQHQHFLQDGITNPLAIS